MTRSLPQSGAAVSAPQFSPTEQELYEALTAAANALRFHADAITYEGSTPVLQMRRLVINEQANAAFATLAKARGETA